LAVVEGSTVCFPRRKKKRFVGVCFAVCNAKREWARGKNPEGKAAEAWIEPRRRKEEKTEKSNLINGSIVQTKEARFEVVLGICASRAGAVCHFWGWETLSRSLRLIIGCNRELLPSET
jgi:hypothetical protein